MSDSGESETQEREERRLRLRESLVPLRLRVLRNNVK